MTSLSTIPSTCTGIRWFGDIHGASAVHDAADEALAKGYAIGFIGDLTDADPADGDTHNDSAAVLRLLARLDAQRQALLVPGNHCFKLLRYLVKWRDGDGREQRMALTHGLDRTLTEIMAAPDRDALVESTIRILSAAPLWRNIGPWLFVHAGASSAMFDRPAPTAGDALSSRGDGRVHRALYGQTDGTRDAADYPVRLYDWFESIPTGRTVVIGHDRCKAVFTQTNAQGGQLVRIDTGAGKGGSLSWLDISARELQGGT